MSLRQRQILTLAPTPSPSSPTLTRLLRGCKHAVLDLSYTARREFSNPTPDPTLARQEFSNPTLTLTPNPHQARQEFVQRHPYPIARVPALCVATSSPNPNPSPDLDPNPNPNSNPDPDPDPDPDPNPNPNQVRRHLRPSAVLAAQAGDRLRGPTLW